MKNCVKWSCWLWIRPQHQGILTVEHRDWLRMFGYFPSPRLLEHVGMSFLAYFSVAPRHEAVLLNICQGNGECGCLLCWAVRERGAWQGATFITGKLVEGVLWYSQNVCVVYASNCMPPKQGLGKRKHAFDLVVFCIALIITNKIAIWASYTTLDGIWSKSIENNLENWIHVEDGIIQK